MVCVRSVFACGLINTHAHAHAYVSKLFSTQPQIQRNRSFAKGEREWASLTTLVLFGYSVWIAFWLCFKSRQFYLPCAIIYCITSAIIKISSYIHAHTVCGDRKITKETTNKKAMNMKIDAVRTNEKQSRKKNWQPTVHLQFVPYNHFSFSGWSHTPFCPPVCKYRSVMACLFQFSLFFHHQSHSLLGRFIWPSLIKTMQYMRCIAISHIYRHINHVQFEVMTTNGAAWRNDNQPKHLNIHWADSKTMCASFAYGFGMLGK